MWKTKTFGRESIQTNIGIYVNSSFSQNLCFGFLECVKEIANELKFHILSSKIYTNIPTLYIFIHFI